MQKKKKKIHRRGYDVFYLPAAILFFLRLSRTSIALLIISVSGGLLHILDAGAFCKADNRSVRSASVFKELLSRLPPEVPHAHVDRKVWNLRVRVSSASFSRPCSPYRTLISWSCTSLITSRKTFKFVCSLLHTSSC